MDRLTAETGQSPQTLDELLRVLQTHKTSDDAWTELPTYGGQPVDAYGVWSWDRKRLLVGRDADDLRIVDRSEWLEVG